MSKYYKCDICGKELSYGVGETARGLIWGKVQPAGPGVNAHVVYKEKSEDFFLEDVCPDCMAKIMEYIPIIRLFKRGITIEEINILLFSNNKEERDKIYIKYKEESKC